MCPTDPKDWKKIEERFRNRWNVPHGVVALDVKQIAIKKPKKSGNEYLNYKGYSLVLFGFNRCRLQISVGERGGGGGSGSASDAQIFSRSKLKRRIENGRLGLPPPEPLGPGGGADLHYFMLGDDAFGLMPCLIKPYSGRQLTREERIANYRISRGRRVVENSFGILGQKVVRDIVLTCVVLHNMLRSHQEELTDHPLQLTTYKNSFGILGQKVVRDIVLTCVVLHNMLRSHQEELTDHPLQLTTYKHHRQTRGNRDIIVTSETHRGRANINETY